jgi:hypothetical protein
MSEAREDGDILAGGGGEPAARAGPGPRSLSLRSNWVWLPLSFIFLLVGTILGFQVALSVRSELTGGPREDPYALKLTASASAGSVHVQWDRQAPAVRQARRGLLWIRDGENEKSVDLDLGHLRYGSVIYRKQSGRVTFRLDVFVGDHQAVSESVDYPDSRSPAS